MGNIKENNLRSLINKHTYLQDSPKFPESSGKLQMHLPEVLCESARSSARYGASAFAFEGSSCASNVSSASESAERTWGGALELRKHSCREECTHSRAAHLPLGICGRWTVFEAEEKSSSVSHQTSQRIC